MRSRFLPACFGLLLVTTGCASHRVAAAASPASAPIIVLNSTREMSPGDYLRISFLPAGTTVTTLSRPGALRAFTTATVLYSPPLKLSEMPYYSGLENNDSNVLVAMRCRPSRPEAVDAVLATWPNVFVAIERDVALASGACTSESSDPAIQMACFARGFTDPPATKAPSALAHTFDYAATLFDDHHTALAQWLKSNYGIYPAFSGTGYSVKDSYSLDKQPMTSQQMLVKSISSEYILKNVPLAGAGCRCISVEPYKDRSEDPIDPQFIWKAGGAGVCKPIRKLENAQTKDKR
jgi:hypothetical protein